MPRLTSINLKTLVKSGQSKSLLNSSIKFANNYSTTTTTTCFKKENSILNQQATQIVTNNNNNKMMMNLFAVKNYSTSTAVLSDDNNSTTNKPAETLNPVEYDTWTKEQVCSLLVAKKVDGGAGLSFEKIKPLYDAGFDGTSLANIVTHIQKKDEYFAIGDTCNSFPTIAPDTLKTVVFWVDNLLKTRFKTNQSIQIYIKFENTQVFTTPDYIKSARTDPRYDYLRNLHDPANMKKLEGMIGTNIPLPPFGEKGSSHVPKDYDPDIPYLLTKQRFEILRKVIKRVEEGYVLSGPHGVSKSYTMCLLAAYAIVNSIPLLYVPVCLVWVSDYRKAKAKADDYLRSLVFLWNYDILSEYDRQVLKSSVDIVGYMSKNIAKDKPVFYLFDEHNELFRKNTEGKIAATEDYFMDYTRWTGVTRGDKTMTIYCGSAHSSFEDYLPGGSDTRIIRIVPPTETEFETLVKDFNLDPKDNRIKFVTGRIPRELKSLAKYLENTKGTITDETITSFMENRQDVYQARLNQLNRELEKINQKNEFIVTLEGLFALGLHAGRPYSTQGIAYDQGLMYRDEHGKLHIINEPAKRVLFNYYCKNYNITAIPQNMSASEKGALFQRYLVAQEYNIGNHNDRFNVISNKIATATTIGKPKKKVNTTDGVRKSSTNNTTTLEYTINVHESLDLKDLSPLYRKEYLQNTVVLFVPELERFPAFDYAIVSYKKDNISIFLKQTTISTVDSHYKKKESESSDIDNLMKRVYIVENNATAIRKKNTDSYPNENLFSLLELIVHGVIGNFGDDENVIITKETKNKSVTTTENIKRRKYDVNSMVLQQGQFEPTITIDDLKINCHYIYESGSPKADQSVAKVKENGILYRSREDIADCMKVYFLDSL